MKGLYIDPYTYLGKSIPSDEPGLYLSSEAEMPMRKGLGLYVSSDAVLEKGFWDWIKKQGKRLFDLTPTKKQLKQMRSQKSPSQQSKYFNRAQQKLSAKLSPKEGAKKEGGYTQGTHVATPMKYPTKKEIAAAREADKVARLHRKLKDVKGKKQTSVANKVANKKVAIKTRQGLLDVLGRSKAQPQVAKKSKRPKGYDPKFESDETTIETAMPPLYQKKGN